MLAIYKYTLSKYLKSYSTWVILCFSAIVIGFVIGGILPFVFIDLTRPTAAVNYSKAVIMTVTGITVFFAIFSAIFAGFKSANMYKDEVENGTFLVVLSKPMRRSQIIVGKWFALQTVLIAYALISVFFYCIGVEIFDNGSKIHELKSIGVESLKSQIWLAGVFVFVILYVTSLIFSSIGLMLSTKLSTGSTIGITIAVGLFIPISGLLGMFVRKVEVSPYSNSPAIMQSFNSSFARELDDNAVLGSLYPDLKDDINDLVDKTKLSDLYGKAIKTEDKDYFQDAWFLDFDYQFKLLSSFAYERVIPRNAVNMIQNGSLGELLGTPEQVKAEKKANSKKMFDDLKSFIGNYRSIGDRLSQAAIYENLIKLQPITNEFALNWFSNKGVQYIKDPVTAFETIKTQFGQIHDLTIDDIQNILKALTDKNIIKHPQEMIKEFLYDALFDETRNSDKFLIKDDYKFKVDGNSTINMNRVIKQAFDDMGGDSSKYSSYTNTKPYPQVFFDELKALRDASGNPLSQGMIELMQEYNKESYDPSMVNLGDDENYLTYGLYKKMLYELFIDIGDESKMNQGQYFPVLNLVSGEIADHHFHLEPDKNGQILFDETFIRNRFFNTSGIADYLPKQLNADGQSDQYITIKNMQNSYSKILNPISTFLFSRDRHYMLEQNNIATRGLTDLRTIYEQGGFDPKLRFNTAEYSNINYDPLENISSSDMNQFSSVVSSAMDSSLVNYSSKPYVDRNVLLGVYVAISLVLLPLAYLVVRKQDFR